MAGISVSSAMLEPQTLDILLRILAFVCWSLNYINTMRTTIKSQVPSISFISICCDVGWEIVYAFIYPLASSHWAGGIRVWLMLHSVMMLTVMKYAPNEWGHVPFMKRYVSVAYVLVTTGFMAGQMALAAEIGPELGFHWGGALCQFMASFAGICHLVTRGSTRGISLKTWYVMSCLNEF
jgi:paspaline synthase